MHRGVKFVIGAGLVVMALALGFVAAIFSKRPGQEEFWVAADMDPQHFPFAEVPADEPPYTPPSEPSLAESLPDVDLAALPAVEARALWVPRWSYVTQADVRTIVQRAASANFNILLFQVRGQGDSYYFSVYEPWADRLAGKLGEYPGWDPLGLAIREGHAAGLQVHAYINVYPSWLGTTPPGNAVPQHMYYRFNSLHGNEWVQWDSNRNPIGLNAHYLAANPGHRAVIDHVVAVCRDIVLNYDVDGVHLDYVRYAGYQYSHDPVSDRRFLQSGMNDRRDWQRAQVTELVTRIYDEVIPLRQGLVLSAAVWPIYRDRWGWVTYDGSTYEGYNGYYQDSRGWLQSGKMDLVAPMLYGTAVKDSRDRFKTLIQDFMSDCYGRHVWAGIHADYASFSEIQARIEMARQAGSQGQAIFAYSVVNEKGYWDEFLQGPYARPAEIPSYTWKH